MLSAPAHRGSDGGESGSPISPRPRSPEERVGDGMGDDVTIGGGLEPPGPVDHHAAEDEGRVARRNGERRSPTRPR